MRLPSHSRPLPGDRLHALDALRAFALLLGIFFHGAAGYIENFPAQLWPMREPPSATLGAFFFVSHMFRMSLFYLLAGFFGRMLLERRGAGPFVRDRAKRILLPLVIGVPAVLITISLFIVVGSLLGGTNLAALQAAFGRPPSVPGQRATFPWAHLWFLYYLLIFYGLALGTRTVLRVLDRGGRLRAALDALLRFVLSGPWGAAPDRRAAGGVFLQPRKLVELDRPAGAVVARARLRIAAGVWHGVRRRLACPSPA
jgi:hypothetical protein